MKRQMQDEYVHAFYPEHSLEVVWGILMFNDRHVSTLLAGYMADACMIGCYGNQCLDWRERFPAFVT